MKAREFNRQLTLVKTNMYRTNVAPMENPRAFKVPCDERCATNTCLAICANEAEDDIFAVFPIILKKTISKGVITRVITEDDTNEAIKTFMKTSRLASFSAPCFSI